MANSTGTGGAQADRRGFLRGTAAGVAAAAGAAAGLTATSGAARAAPRDLPNPPGPGERYAFPFRAAGTPVSWAGEVSQPGDPGSTGSRSAAPTSLDFQGELGFQVTAGDPHHPWNVRMRVTRFRATAYDSRQLGQVALELGPASPEGLLVVTSEQPARWRHAVLLDIVMTVENPPAEWSAGQSASSSSGEPDGQPLVLRTRAPAELVGDLDLFPPQGSDYALRRPVELVRSGGEVGAELPRLPMRVGAD